MNNQSDVNVQWLRAVSGVPLTLLFGFAIADADLVTAQWLRAVSSKSQDTIARDIPALEALGLVEKVTRYAWRLTPRGQIAAAAVRTLLSTLTPQIAESLPANHQLPLPVSPQIAESPVGAGSLPLLAPPERDGITSTVKSDSAICGVKSPTTTTNIDNSNNLNTVAVGNQRKDFAIALRAANVYPNVAKRLADD